jgi:hypothetical protein
MKIWSKNVKKSLLELGHDLWYVSRAGIHTYSAASCGHGNTSGGYECDNCLITKMSEILEKAKPKQERVNLSGNPHMKREHKGCSPKTCYYSLSRGAMIERSKKRNRKTA